VEDTRNQAHHYLGKEFILQKTKTKIKTKIKTKTKKEEKEKDLKKTWVNMCIYSNYVQDHQNTLLSFLNLVDNNQCNIGRCDGAEYQEE
jgi:hypothetical protein